MDQCDGISSDSDLELNFEVKKSKGIDQQGSTEATVLKLFETQLAGRISKLIEQEATQAIERAVAKTVLPTAGSSNGVGIGSQEKDDLKGAAAMLGEFDPEDRDCNIDRWLSTIDDLANIHGWSDSQRIYLMHVKLRGSARSWFKRRDEPYLTWNDLKEALKKTFSKQLDFAVCLEELVERHKLADETMTQYFKAKLALCGRVDVTGEKAVSCIIRGLPDELRPNAYACRCDTPETLYSEYLEGLENYKSPKAMGPTRKVAPYSVEAKGRRPIPIDNAAKRQRTDNVKLIRCYNCQEYGTHTSKDCTKPKRERCSYCGREGHFFEKCYFKNKLSKERNDEGARDGGFGRPRLVSHDHQVDSV